MAGITKTTQNICSEQGWALLSYCWKHENHAKHMLRARLGAAVVWLESRKPRKTYAPSKVGRCCRMAGSTKTTQNACSEQGWALLSYGWKHENHAKHMLRARLGAAVVWLEARKPCKTRAPSKVGRCCRMAGSTKTTQNTCSEQGWALLWYSCFQPYDS